LIKISLQPCKLEVEVPICNENSLAFCRRGIAHHFSDTKFIVDRDSIGVRCKIEFLTFPTSVLQCLTMSTLTIRLPDELKADLQKFSQEQNKPVSDVVRESIRRYVAIEKFRAIRKKVLPFAEAQGFLTDEDVFKAIS